MDLTRITPEFCARNHDEALRVIQENWKQIPLLGPVPEEELKDGELIRFHGMVQDMANPNYYLAQYQVTDNNTGERQMRCGKYKETVWFGEHESLNLGEDVEHLERKPYFCISVPGLNDWARPSFSKPRPAPVENGAAGSTDDSLKRCMEVDGEDAQPNQNKRHCGERRRRIPDNYFPIPHEGNYGCVVTLYDQAEDSVKLNEIIEAAGFYWRPFAQEEAGDEEEQDVNFPSAPRLHAVTFKKISSSTPYCSSTLERGNVLSQAKYLRDDLHLALTQLMCGDTLAADYLICHLLSSVFLRQDVLALGKFALNISHVPLSGTYTDRVYSILSQLVPKSHYMALSIRNMNSLLMIPEKDYDQNRLKPGMLQLSDRTHLVLDETKLECGRLEEKGVNNLKTLNDLITHQKLSYCFKYYPMEILTDIPILIFSEGKSMLSSDYHVILQPLESCLGSPQENCEAVEQFLTGQLLVNLRSFISYLAQFDYSLPDDLQEAIQSDFVKMRQDADNKTTADDLHALLVLGRYMSLSRGSSQLTKEIWEDCQEMEKMRKLRIRQKAVRPQST